MKKVIALTISLGWLAAGCASREPDFDRHFADVRDLLRRPGGLTNARLQAVANRPRPARETLPAVNPGPVNGNDVGKAIEVQPATTIAPNAASPVGDNSSGLHPPPGSTGRAWSDPGNSGAGSALWNLSTNRLNQGSSSGGSFNSSSGGSGASSRSSSGRSSPAGGTLPK